MPLLLLKRGHYTFIGATNIDSVDAVFLSCRSSASLKMDAVIEGSPKVLLISPSADLANYDRYREFLRSFEDSLAHLNKQWKCVDIDPFKSLSDTSPDNVGRIHFNVHLCIFDDSSYVLLILNYPNIILHFPQFG